MVDFDEYEGLVMPAGRINETAANFQHHRLFQWIVSMKMEWTINHQLSQTRFICTLRQIVVPRIPIPMGYLDT